MSTKEEQAAARAKKRLDIKSKLGTAGYKFDSHENAHIVVEQDICRDCQHHMCVWGCPAECYTEHKDKKAYGNKLVKFQFEDCVECGTCFVMCDQGAVAWSMPRGTYGVKYSYG